MSSCHTPGTVPPELLLPTTTPSCIPGHSEQGAYSYNIIRPRTAMFRAAWWALPQSTGAVTRHFCRDDVPKRCVQHVGRTCVSSCHTPGTVPPELLLPTTTPSCCRLSYLGAYSYNIIRSHTGGHCPNQPAPSACASAEMTFPSDECNMLGRKRVSSCNALLHSWHDATRAAIADYDTFLLPIAIPRRVRLRHH
eukprot:COSAG02_NODE_1436_length_12609_cov_1282.385292_2_plen_194_part_00